jgi:pimeloyl-ACP methyl ester carboxylesterase
MSLFFSIPRHLAIGALCIVFSCAPAVAATYLVAQDFGNNPAAGHSFVFNGNRFYYEIYGKGAPLLLIHGNGESISSFKGQIGTFAQHHRVIAMDSRGQGKSELGTAVLSYEQMSEDTNALLDHLMLDHVKVLGWSDGGIIGLLLTIHHPEKVGMLAVMGANLEKSQLAIFPGATHMIPAQDPSRFNSTVLDFFDQPFAMPDTKDLGWFD